jgi:hypothetical protein
VPLWAFGRLRAGLSQVSSWRGFATRGNEIGRCTGMWVVNNCPISLQAAGRSRYSSDNPHPPSLHSRFGDDLDGRRQIGSKPAAGDVGSADAPRALRQAPPTYEPDEPRGPFLGERTLLFLVGSREAAVRRLVLVVLVPLSPRAALPGHCSGTGDGGDLDCLGGVLTRRRLAPCRPRGCAPSPKRSRLARRSENESNGPGTL